MEQYVANSCGMKCEQKHDGSATELWQIWRSGFWFAVNSGPWFFLFSLWNKLCLFIEMTVLIDCMNIEALTSSHWSHHFLQTLGKVPPVKISDWRRVIGSYSLVSSSVMVKLLSLFCSSITGQLSEMPWMHSLLILDLLCGEQAVCSFTSQRGEKKLRMHI